MEFTEWTLHLGAMSGDFLIDVGFGALKCGLINLVTWVGELVDMVELTNFPSG